MNIRETQRGEEEKKFLNSLFTAPFEHLAAEKKRRTRA
jgi:hypothetical protein